MARFTRTLTIDAPRSDVWDVLADIGTIAEWNPGVDASWRTSDRPSGLGSERHCDLSTGNRLEERVVEWEPEGILTMDIYDTDMPFARAQIRFTLTPNGSGTEVSVTPDYTLKFGPLGTLLDVLMVRRQYTRGMDALLAGLKEHVERQQAPQHPDR